ncbi:MAG: septum formation initiator family protein [Paludibacteraceae bacterium]|nr:septum formation initiator family protein [Paludibacteraceae bacterium]
MNILRKIFNKYTITLAVFLFFLFLGEKHNLRQRAKYKHEIEELEKEIEYYKSETEKINERLKELTLENENLERFAREQYLMKNPDEDVYVIRDKGQGSRVKD